MLTPAYRLNVGSRVVDTTDEPRASTLVDLTVELGQDVPADAATLVLGNVGGLRPAAGESASIELGYADEGAGGVEKVFTGKVEHVDAGVAVTRVLLAGAAAPLLRTFTDETFEGQTAGALLRDLAGRAGVRVGEAEAGISFPAYVVDGRRSLGHHLREMASLSGLDLWTDPQGRLLMKRWAGGRIVHELKYGSDVLDVELMRLPPLAGKVQAWGESPTGAEGTEAWGWLTPDFEGSRGEAGDGGLLLLERPVLRTRDAARTAAEAALAEIRRRAVRGRLRTLGRPGVRPGDALKLEGTPGGALDGTYAVRGVTHRMTKTGGFVTDAHFQAAEAA